MDRDYLTNDDGDDAYEPYFVGDMAGILLIN